MYNMYNIYDMYNKYDMHNMHNMCNLYVICTPINQWFPGIFLPIQLGVFIHRKHLVGHVLKGGEIHQMFQPRAEPHHSNWWLSHPRKNISQIGSSSQLLGKIWQSLNKHLEKYEFVNGKDDIPYMKWKIIQPCLKPPTSIFTINQHH